jgi:hypothetical protein
MRWLDVTGKPVEPDWRECTLAKTMENMHDLDAVACLQDLVPDADGDLHGPSVKVGGQDFEVIQITLPSLRSLVNWTLTCRRTWAEQHTCRCQ